MEKDRKKGITGPIKKRKILIDTEEFPLLLCWLLRKNSSAFFVHVVVPSGDFYLGAAEAAHCYHTVVETKIRVVFEIFGVANLKRYI